MATERKRLRPYERPGYFDAVFTIIRTGYQLVSRMNDVLKPYQLTEPQYNVLATLNSAGDTPLCLDSIKANMVQRESNVSRLIDKLVERNLVTRIICQENRRKMDVSITKQGRKLFLQAAQAVLTMHAGMAEHITEAEAAEAAGILRNLLPDSAIHPSANYSKTAEV